MRSVKCISAIFGCLILTVAFAMGGCGKSNTTQTDAMDLAQLAQVCDDGCNTIMTCVEEVTGNDIPDGEVEGYLAECLDGCNTPDGDEELARDCAVACDQTADCAAYLDCICGCGIEVLDGCA